MLILTVSSKSYCTYTSPKIYQYSAKNIDLTILHIKSIKSNDWELAESPNFGRGGGYGLVKFDVQNKNNIPQYLEIVGHFKENITLWIYEKDSLQLYKSLTTRDQFKENPILHRHFLFDLHIKSNLTIYIKSYNYPGDALKFPIRVWNQHDFINENQFDIWLWAIFTGIMLMTILISLFNYIFHTQKIYLYYAAYILCFGMYSLLNAGWGVLLPNYLGFLDELVAISYWINFGIYFFLFFSQNFLAVKPTENPSWSFIKLNPLWGLLSVQCFLVAATVAKFYHSASYFNYFATGGFLSILIYIFIWLAYVADAFKRNFKPVWLHVLSGSMMLIINLIFYFLVNSGVLKVPLSEMGIFRIALILDVFVILISWLYRQNLIQRNQQHLERENKHQQIAIYNQTINQLKYEQNLKIQRERIARDLHDGIGSQLSHIIGQIDLLSLRDKNQRELVLLGDFTRETNQTLRDNLWVLNKESVYGIDFKQRLTGYIARICSDLETPLVSYAFNLPDNLMLNPQITSSLFYIIQEALNNTLKYANSQIVQISMYKKDENLMLFFEDNGKGFDTKNLSSGYGLTNIKKRVEELEGIFSIYSTNRGTNISISIPYEENLVENTPFDVLIKVKQIKNFERK